MRIAFLLVVYCSLVYGKCEFHTDEHNEKFAIAMKNWKIYEKTLTITSNGFTYAVGICSSVTSNNAAIIQNGTNSSIVLGKLDRVNLVGGANWLLITYENGDVYNNVCDNTTRSASIMFVCGSNMNNISVLQADTSTDQHCNYMFQVQVPEICPPVVVESEKLGGGAIFVIILFSLAATYLVVGGIYMHVKRGARGMDRIPNLEMWRKLGHLAADGCDFCCRCERQTTRAGYFLDESGQDLRGDDDILSP